jgi:hypothetical protein
VKNVTKYYISPVIEVAQVNSLQEEVDRLTAENKWFRAKLDKCERLSEFKG